MEVNPLIEDTWPVGLVVEDDYNAREEAEGNMFNKVCGTTSLRKGVVSQTAWVHLGLD
jgi:hypothetical protein